MIKCCQNCYHFQKGADICESGELTPMVDEMVELIENDGGTNYSEYAHVASVTIKDPQNFCCNAWR